MIEVVNFKAIRNQGNVQLNDSCIGKCAKIEIGNVCGFAEVKGFADDCVNVQWIAETSDNNVLNIQPHMYDCDCKYRLKDVNCVGIHDMDKNYMLYRRAKSRSAACDFTPKRICKEIETVGVASDYQYE